MAINPSPFELEDFLIPIEKWDQDPSWKQKVPQDIQQDLLRGDYPMGLARHPTLGWCVLASGQGPFVVWGEWL